MTAHEPLFCDVAEHSGGLTVVIATTETTPPSLLCDKRFPGHTLDDAERTVASLGYAYAGPRREPCDQVGYRVSVTPISPA